jgi:hypothetical protein
MTGKQPRFPKSVPSQKADDFILINGIGPALAARLHKAGIRTYAQLGSQSAVELAARVSGLSAKQIARQDWIGQARKLARKKAHPQAGKKATVRPMIRQHYENFTVEFLLDGKNTLRRTRVIHIQSGDADTWAGWESQQLIGFLARHAGIQVPQSKAQTPRVIVTEQIALPETGNAYPPADIRSAHPVPRLSATTAVAPTGVDISKPISQSLNSSDLTGTLSLCDLKAMPINSDTPISFIHEGEPYRLGLTLDLSYVAAPGDSRLRYKAMIMCKQVGGSIHTENETSGTLRKSDRATVAVIGTRLTAGIYRLEAFVSLVSDKPVPGPIAFLRGDLLQVYDAPRFHRSSESN